MAWMFEWWWALWGILVESGVWLLAGFAIAGVLHVLVPRSFLERALGGKGLGPVIRGALIGAPLPLCSCSVIPTAAGLKRSGASRGASAAFAVASPEVDVPAVGLTWGLLGPWFALTRPVVAVAVAIATGLSLEAMGSKRTAGSEAAAGGDENVRAPQAREVSLSVLGGNSVELQKSSCCQSEPVKASESCCSSQPPVRAGTSLAGRLAEMLRFAFVTLPGSLAWWMLLGLGIAALASVLVPTEWLSEHEGTLAGGLLVQSIVALVIGVPLYVCATSSTPMALAMLLAGAQPGAVLVFLLAGPATNPATIAWVTRDFGVRSAAVYVAVIASSSLGAGLMLNGLLSAHMRLATIEEAHVHGASVLSQIAAGVLLLVLLAAIVRPAVAKLTAKQSKGCCGGHGE